MSASFPASNSTANGRQLNPYPYVLPAALAPSSPDPLHIQMPNQAPHPSRQQQSPAPRQAQAPPQSASTPQLPQYPRSEHIDHLPLPLPISESDNPDAIALRAAMSVLQIQRQQALRDLKMLEKQKGMAMEDPEGFARAVQRGDVRARGMSGVGPYGGGEEEEDEEEKEEMDETAQEDKLVKPEADGVIQMDRRTDGVATEAGPVGRGVNSMRTDNRQPRVTAGIAATQREAYKDFGDIPSSQNVVRMPPINWAQYHIVGESLDKLHEEQRVRPSPGQPARDEDLRPRERAPESVIAAPYNPWTDKVGTKEGRTRSSGGGGGKGGKVGKKKG